MTSDGPLVKVKSLLKEAKHMCIAVVTDDGSPWVVPVVIRHHRGAKLSWVSSVRTVHSRAIEREPRIAITIFLTQHDEWKEVGFYATAIAKKGIAMPGGYATYTATIERAWYNGQEHKKTEIAIENL